MELTELQLNKLSETQNKIIKELNLNEQEIKRIIEWKNPGYNEIPYYDGYLKQNLDIIKDAAKMDWDFCFAVAGDERVGKSCFTFQVAKYLDPKFNESHIAFSGEELMKIGESFPENSTLIWDESIEGGASTDTLTRASIILKKFFAQIGYKNHNLFMLIPNYFDLNKSLALHRTRGLFRIYAKSFNERGYFQYFDKHRKQNLFIMGKKYYDYTKQAPNFHGVFSHNWVINKELYMLMKARALGNIKKDDKTRATRWQTQRNKLLTLVMDHRKILGLTARKIADFLGMDESVINDLYAITKNKKYD